LKELIISAVMKWMPESVSGFAGVLAEQAEVLRGQMKTETPESS